MFSPLFGSWVGSSFGSSARHFVSRLSSGLAVWLVFFVLGVAALPQAQAQFQTGAVSAAVGGAGRAAVEPSESVLLNPATLPHLRGYFIAADGFTGWHPVEGNTKGFSILISDGSPDTIIPGAFSFVRRWRELPSGLSATEQDMQIALSGFVLSKLTLGVAGHRQTWTPTVGSEYSQTNANVGVLFSPTEWLGFALTGYDVLSPDEQIPVGVRTVPTVAFGSHVMLEKMFRLRFDLVRPTAQNPDGRVDVMTGLESYFLQTSVFRFGAQWRETADQMLITTGLGFRGPRLSFNYAFERDIRQADGSRHLFDLWLPF